MDNLFRLTLCALLAFAAFAWPARASAGCDAVTGICATQAEALAAVKASCQPFVAPHPLAGATVVGYFDSPLTSGTYQGVDYLGFSRSELQNPSGGLAGCNGYSSFERYAWFANVPPNLCADKAGQSYSGWNYTSTWPPAASGCASGSECKITLSVGSAPVVTGGTGSVVAYYGTSTYTGDSCSTEDAPVQEAPKDEAGEGWKCDPATGMCTDPNGNGKLCTFNPDGSRSNCVDYKPGDGTEPTPDTPEEPDDPRDKRAASGGESCAAAPACSGDPIDCAQLWQQFKTRCAVANVESASGVGCSNGVALTLNCTNMDPARCLELQLASDTACRVASLDTGGSSGPGDGEEGGVDTSGMGNANDFGDSGYSPGDAWRPGVGEPGGPTEPQLFDDTGFLGGGRTCPVMPIINVYGTVIDFNFPQLCWFLGIGANLILIFAALSSIRIVSRVI